MSEQLKEMAACYGMLPTNVPLFQAYEDIKQFTLDIIAQGRKENVSYKDIGSLVNFSGGYCASRM
jgi:hypothetical protein